jgi:putative peptidoglycan lipid II flippase
LQKVFSPAYYAQEDMKRPLKFAIYTMVVNAGFSLIGLWLFQTQNLELSYLAIPIGTTLAGWLNVILLWHGSKNLYVMDDRLRKRFPRLLGASLGMGGVLYVVSSVSSSYFDDTFLRYPALGVLIIAGIISYGVLCHFTGAFRLQELKSMLKRK